MSTRRKLAIVSTHPIQYYAPVFRELARAENIDLRVFYTWSQTSAGGVHDRGFNREVAWDIPLLDGYASEFVPNVAKRPGSDQFFGVRNPTLRAAIADWGAEAVLVYGWNLYSHLDVMRYFHRRIPVFFRGDSTLLGQRSWWRSALRRIALTWVYSHINVALAVGKHSAQYFRWCGLAAQRVTIAPHAVDNRRFSDDVGRYDVEASSCRAQLGIPADSIVILFAAKMIAVKEPELLIDAFLTCTSAHLVMVGSGPLDAVVQRRAAQHPRIHFLPFQNQAAMPAIYRVGDVFVLPSRSETWGLALNEAMASGRPVIASTSVGAACDLIIDNVNGWTFHTNDRDDLAQLLHRVTSIPRNTLRAMGIAAQEIIQDWSPHESARKIAAAVEQQWMMATKRSSNKQARSALRVN